MVQQHITSINPSCLPLAAVYIILHAHVVVCEPRRPTVGLLLSLSQHGVFACCCITNCACFVACCVLGVRTAQCMCMPACVVLCRQCCSGRAHTVPKAVGQLQASRMGTCGLRRGHNQQAPGGRQPHCTNLPSVWLISSSCCLRLTDCTGGEGLGPRRGADQLPRVQCKKPFFASWHTLQPTPHTHNAWCSAATYILVGSAADPCGSLRPVLCVVIAELNVGCVCMCDTTKCEGFRAPALRRGLASGCQSQSHSMARVCLCLWSERQAQCGGALKGEADCGL